jgi:glycosyltransferase involved in cell wall biosynthesis
VVVSIPSSDATSMSILEAMACRKPVVAITAGGIPDQPAHMNNENYTKYEARFLTQQLSLVLNNSFS